MAPTSDDDLKSRTKFEPERLVDPCWAILFVINVLALAAYVGYAASSGELTWAINTLNSDQTVELLQGNFAKAGVDPEASSVVLITLSFALSMAYACFWMWALIKYPMEVVVGSIYVMATVLIIFGLLTLAASPIGGLIMLVCGMIFCCIPCCMREQLKFTARIVNGVSSVYSGQRSIFLVAIFCIFLQACWIATSITAMIPASAYQAEDERKEQEAEAAGEEAPPSSGGGAALLLLVFCYYWGIQVFSNLLHISCSGVIARYYFNKQLDNAVYKSTSQSFTYYLGPVALGSFLIAIIQTLKYIAESLASKNENNRRGGNAAEQVLVCVAICCLKCLERLMEVFNTFCFIFTAMYGTSFCESGQKVVNLLFSRDGFQTINQYNLIGIVCFIGNLFGSLIIAGIVALLAAIMLLPSGYISMCGFCAFFVCFAIMMVVSRVVESGCDTLVVCYIEEPEKARTSAEEIHDAFEAMRERKPLRR